MSPRRVPILALATAILTAACAPGPSLDAADPPPVTTAPAPTPTPSPDPTPPTPPADDGIPQIAPFDLFPVAPDDLPALDRVDGRIAYHGTDAAMRSGRSTVELDTGTLPGQPTWSRDGTRLAMVSLDGRQPEIHVFDGETGDLLASEQTPRLHFFLTWSHDGSRIAALGPGVDGGGNPRTVLDILDADGAVIHSDVLSATSLYVAWDPDGLRLAAHADDRLHRVDPDGTTADLGAVGIEFFAPKWIPGTDEILLVTDIEGSSLVVRRRIDGQDTLRSLGDAEPQLGIAVHPDGDVAAISHDFEIESDPAAEQIGLPFLPQTALLQTVLPQTVLPQTVLPQTVLPQTVLPQTVQPSRSGSVEILDLDTGERVEVFSGFSLWVEWNPQGTQLLIYEADPGADLGTWWIYDHEPGTPPEPPREIVAFTPTPIFLRSYLVFADQFIETPRLWSPDGTRFTYAELTEQGSLIRTADADGVATPTTVGAGEVGFWSPPVPPR